MTVTKCKNMHKTAYSFVQKESNAVFLPN